MKYITISDETYKEFVEFLKENNVTDYNIRIILSGMGCHGPALNIALSEPREGDVTEVVNDVTFIMEQNLIDEFEGFIIEGSAENEAGQMMIKAKNPGEGCCSSCGGGCH